MKCPKCNSLKIQPITDDKKRLYCVDCNYAWKLENKDKEPKGDLNFNGVPSARAIFDVLTKGQEFSPEFRAALESQVTALLFDQWFEGFKAGQMASILYAREFYGKNRDDGCGTNCSCKTRNSGINKVGENRRVRRGQDAANPRAAEVNPTITERVNGATLTYPRGIKVPDNMFESLAKLIEELPGSVRNNFLYDGHKLTVEVDW